MQPCNQTCPAVRRNSCYRTHCILPGSVSLLLTRPPYVYITLLFTRIYDHYQLSVLCVIYPACLQSRSEPPETALIIAAAGVFFPILLTLSLSLPLSLSHTHTLLLRMLYEYMTLTSLALYPLGLFEVFTKQKFPD